MHAVLKLRCCLVLLVALAMPAHAGTVLTVDGALHEGEISIDRGLVVRASPATVRLPLSSVLRARFAAAAPEFQPGVVLVNGGRIAGAFSALGETPVRFERKRIAVPSNEIAWAIYKPTGMDLIAQIPRGKTGALLQGGDFFEGTVRGGDARTAKVLNPIFGPRTFAAKDLQALILRELKPQVAAFDVLTRDGSIYPALDVLANDSGGISLRHSFYEGMRIPTEELVEIRASATRLLPLDDIKPTRVDPAPGREAAGCFAANRALDGGALKLGIRPVAAGFESAAGATVWWKPPPGAGTFFAVVAASLATPPGQRLTFTVYADNRLAGRSAPLGAGDPPAVLRCAVPGVQSLVLRIEGTDGTGTWAEPMLLRR